MSDKDQVINEEQLEDVAGGGDAYIPKCYFTTNGKTKHDGNRLLGICISHCFGLMGKCECHGKDHCVDRWHLLHSTTHELEPDGFSNHRDKRKARNYST